MLKGKTPHIIQNPLCLDWVRGKLDKELQCKSEHFLESQYPAYTQFYLVYQIFSL